MNDMAIISKNLKALEKASQELDTTAQETGLTNHQEKNEISESKYEDTHSLQEHRNRRV